MQSVDGQDLPQGSLREAAADSLMARSYFPKSRSSSEKHLAVQGFHN